MTSVVLLFEERSLPFLVDGKVPHDPFSHNQHLYQFGHESLRKEYDVYAGSFATYHVNPVIRKIIQLYPVIRIGGELPASVIGSDPDLVVSISFNAAELRPSFPTAKIIVIAPAIHFIENLDLVTSPMLYTFQTAARSQVDFFITQNPRMAEILSILIRFIARVDVSDRVLICPLGIVPEQVKALPPREETRKEMGLGSGDIAIINTGGPWHWTDYNTFLHAFCNVVRGGVTNIKFYIMGFRQPENDDHGEYIAETHAIIANNSDMVGKNLIVFEDWYEATKVVNRYTMAADIGINVNKDTLESWQSFRVRFLEYMKAGVPVINTVGDYLSAYDAEDAVYPVLPGHVGDYEAAIRKIVNDPDLRTKKAEAMRRCSHSFASVNTYGKVIDQLIAMPPRDYKNEKRELLVSELAKPEVNWKSPEETSVLARQFPLWVLIKALAGKIMPFGGNKKRWKAPADWIGKGQGAEACAIPFFGENDVALSFGFELEFERPVSGPWAEVLQIGASPKEARLILYVAPTGRKIYQLVLRIFDTNQRQTILKTPPLAVDESAKCKFYIDAATGLARIDINGSVLYELSTPWRWIDIDRIWLGARRLPAAIRSFWIKSGA